LGKAALVDLLVSQDPALEFADVAALSINDINILIAAREANIPGVNSNGQASSGAYIGDEKAKTIALSHAGLTEPSVQSMKIKMDYDDGHMIYKVEFRGGNMECDYEIDASNGAILKSEKKTDSSMRESSASIPPKPPAAAGSQSGPPQESQYISNGAAKQIALSHANAPESALEKYDSKLDKNDGIIIYKIEFVYAGMKYEYRVDAITGEIVNWESKED
jgi:uncharacterized membrane protein YkoI